MNTFIVFVLCFYLWYMWILMKRPQMNHPPPEVSFLSADTGDS